MRWNGKDLEMDVIEVRIVDSPYFYALTPCGRAWPGMRHTQDVSIVVDRAMDHVKGCADCAALRPGQRP
jgi:hypothetical protein